VKRYPPVERCIYCRSDGSQTGGLTKEHVIADALGGRLVLAKSSCKPCATITGRFEQASIRRMLDPFRGKYGLSTRRKKGRRTEFPLRFHFNDRVEERLVHFSTHPFVLALPNFGSEPGILNEAPHGATTFLVIRDSAAAFRGAGSLSHTMAFSTGDFARTLAKIAHAITVADYGLENFKPFLIDFILTGRSDQPYYYYIGSPPQPTPDDKASSPTHELSIKFFELQRGPWLGVVTIRLFANLGTPRYHVVVGEFPELPSAAQSESGALQDP
jgi:HNH endonuclease